MEALRITSMPLCERGEKGSKARLHTRRQPSLKGSAHNPDYEFRLSLESLVNRIKNWLLNQ